MGLIDSHAHLTDPALCEHFDDVLRRWRQADVEQIITVGTDVKDAERAIALAHAHPGVIHASAGIHPHHAEAATLPQIDRISELWRDPSVVACGEIGLDYHYDFADRAVQRSILKRQLERARPTGKPLVIHCREAIDDTLAELVEAGFAHLPVVFHCFTGSAEEERKLREHGWRVSFTGIVTFPKSVEIQEIARVYPDEWLMIETDSPYLSPVPHRGKHPNEPSRVADVARFLAELRGVSCEELVETTRRNTQAFFRLP